MIHKILKDVPLILASASPRRKEIFELIGLKALQIPADIHEEILPVSPAKLVKIYSREKAEKVARQVDPECLVIAADTIVYIDGKILGKPENVIEAAEYLTRLSTNFHYVYTGISLCYKNNIYSKYAKSRVQFKKLTAIEIETYIKTGEPLDKAGAYGIQGYGAQFIEQISGCYFNVMGFPISLFYEMIKEIFHYEKITY